MLRLFKRKTSASGLETGDGIMQSTCSYNSCTCPTSVCICNNIRGTASSLFMKDKNKIANKKPPLLKKCKSCGERLPDNFFTWGFKQWDKKTGESYYKKNSECSLCSFWPWSGI